MRKVITYGTFDMLHYGHINLLRRAKSLGDYYVDLVIPEASWYQKISDVQEFRVDTFCMGDDWKGKFDFLEPYCEVVYFGRTPEISTTRIKDELGQTLAK